MDAEKRSFAYIPGEYHQVVNTSFRVAPKELIIALLSLCGLPSDVYWDEDVQSFRTAVDVSYHGRPLYKYTDRTPTAGMEQFAHSTLVLKEELIKAGLANGNDF